MPNYILQKEWIASGFKHHMLSPGEVLVPYKFNTRVYWHERSGYYFPKSMVENNPDWFKMEETVLDKAIIVQLKEVEEAFNAARQKWLPVGTINKIFRYNDFADFCRYKEHIESKKL